MSILKSSTAEAESAEDRPSDDVATAPPGKALWRRLAGWIFTVVACLFVLFALLAPNKFRLYTPMVFVRLPLEAIIGAALLLVLPARVRTVVAALVGVVLGLLALEKVVDVGFNAVLDRPFNLVLDWSYFGNAMDYITDSMNHTAAIGALVAAVVIFIVGLVVSTFSMLHLTGILVRHRSRAAGVLAVLGVAWVICAVLGTQFVAKTPIASRSAADFLYQDAQHVRGGLDDRREFAKQAAIDPFRNTPNDKLLTGLQGKDVMLVFVESYGRSAVEDPGLAPGVDPVLESGTKQLKAAGFASESGWLTSPTYGGGSWLAHGTLLSGLWVDNQQRHDTLVKGDRLTLTSAFQKANWRTVAVMPDTRKDWPEGAFYGYDKIYAQQQLGYQGPTFGWATMPDQYTLSMFQRSELANPDRPPVMSELVLVSSHTPWAPLPHMINWNDIGNGSVFDPQPKAAKQANQVWPNSTKVRAQYGQSIQYTLNSLISYLKTYGTKNTVMIFLGDHQPASIVTGEGASHDVPIAIVAHDPAVLKQIDSWGWTDGLKPAHNAPVWPMSAFRDKFLTAFSTP